MKSSHPWHGRQHKETHHTKPLAALTLANDAQAATACQAGSFAGGHEHGMSCGLGVVGAAVTHKNISRTADKRRSCSPAENPVSSNAFLAAVEPGTNPTGWLETAGRSPFHGLHQATCSRRAMDQSSRWVRKTRSGRSIRKRDS